METIGEGTKISVANTIGEENKISATNTNQIFVKSISGKTLAIDIDVTNTVIELKQKIFEKENIPIDVQKLIYGGTELINPDEPLSKYNIEKDSTIYLILSLKGG